MAYEYQALTNSISYLHDATELLSKLSNAEFDNVGTFKGALRPLVSICYHALHVLNTRAIQVKYMNANNDLEAQAAIHTVKAKDAYAPKPINELELAI
jgi:hypothetical protein